MPAPAPLPPPLPPTPVAEYEGLIWLPKLAKWKGTFVHPVLRRIVSCGAFTSPYEAAKERHMELQRLGEAGRGILSDFVWQEDDQDNRRFTVPDALNRVFELPPPPPPPVSTLADLATAADWDGPSVWAPSVPKGNAAGEDSSYASAAASKPRGAGKSNRRLGGTAAAVAGGVLPPYRTRNATAQRTAAAAVVTSGGSIRGPRRRGGSGSSGSTGFGGAFPAAPPVPAVQTVAWDPMADLAGGSESASPQHWQQDEAAAAGVQARIPSSVWAGGAGAAGVAGGGAGGLAPAAPPQWLSACHWGVPQPPPVHTLALAAMPQPADLAAGLDLWRLLAAASGCRGPTVAPQPATGGTAAKLLLQFAAQLNETRVT